jgi:hypothetical protein
MPPEADLPTALAAALEGPGLGVVPIAVERGAVRIGVLAGPATGAR